MNFLETRNLNKIIHISASLTIFYYIRAKYTVNSFKKGHEDAENSLENFSTSIFSRLLRV